MLFIFQKNDLGQVVLDYVCDILNIVEKDYFGLRYVDTNRHRVSQNLFLTVCSPGVDCRKAQAELFGTRLLLWISCAWKSVKIPRGERLKNGHVSGAFGRFLWPTRELEPFGSIRAEVSFLSISRTFGLVKPHPGLSRLVGRMNARSLAARSSEALITSRRIRLKVAEKLLTKSAYTSTGLSSYI